MKRSDVVLASCLVLASAVYVFHAFALPQGASGGVPRAGTFPLYVGLGLLAASLAYLGSAGSALLAGRGGADTPLFDRRTLALVAIMVAYVAALPYVGFVLATAIFSLVVLKAYFGKAWPQTLLASGIMVVVPYVIFIQLLRLPLPIGAWFE